MEVEQILKNIDERFYSELEPRLLNDLIDLTKELAYDLEDMQGDSQQSVGMLKDLFKLKQSIRDEKSLLSKYFSDQRSADSVLNDWSSKTKTSKYSDIDLPVATKEALTNFKRELWGINHAGTPYELDSDDFENSDEIVVAHDSFNLNCPITLTPMEDPVTNLDCNHSYSKRGYQQLKQSQGNHVTCPISGCNARVQNPRPNVALTRKILRARCALLANPEKEKDDYETIS